jgi:hypothetical protein
LNYLKICHVSSAKNFTAPLIPKWQNSFNKLKKEDYMKLLSPRTHTIIGFIVGIALLFAPNIFGFNDVGGAAVAIPRILGIIILLSELTVRGSFSGMDLVPMKTHLALDVVLGIFLALSPWLFGFSDKGTNAWLPHLIVGLLIIGYVPMTRTEKEENQVQHKAHPAH